MPVTNPNGGQRGGRVVGGGGPGRSRAGPRDDPRHVPAVFGRRPRDLRVRVVDRPAADPPLSPVSRDGANRLATLPPLPIPVHLAASANGLPSLSRQIAHRSPGWMTVPPSPRIRSSVAGRSETVK